MGKITKKNNFQSTKKKIYNLQYSKWLLTKCANSKVATTKMYDFQSGKLQNVQFPIGESSKQTS